MKGKYSQESQDFPENFDEDLNENSLVAFLKQNKPIAPSPAPDFERQLFARLANIRCVHLNFN